VSGQIHAPATLSLGNEPHCAHWVGSWTGPRIGLDLLANEILLTPPGTEPRLSSPCKVSKAVPLCHSNPKGVRRKAPALS
jgi:hypothetical protein